jgi:hypothetical protein
MAAFLSNFKGEGRNVLVRAIRRSIGHAQEVTAECIVVLRDRVTHDERYHPRLAWLSNLRAAYLAAFIRRLFRSA